ncbi:choice-of-anchor I family protein [Motilibacter deserti]|uniref:Alkaline phosphatase n=1 Tax=Motilibacter deserti TaxID=2714956 RepID=A0ABX0GWT7_9ACTN|nr:choice-of-anchor I family protein [Motilibacter deserti]NHC14175.1 alkaline phosphatase [Motilibacter deserti]
MTFPRRATTLSLPLTVLALGAACLAAFPTHAATAASAPAATLRALGTFTGSGAEIGAYDPTTRRLFVTDLADQEVDILDISDPASPELVRSVDLSEFGGDVTSVAVAGGVVAAAVKSDSQQLPGSVVFFTPDGRRLGDVRVGAGPDSLAFTKNGKRLVVANEGEPDGYCAGGVDPEGSISVIDLKNGPARAVVRTAGFGAFARGGLDPAVRISGPGATVAQDLEPEYVSIAPNGQQAFVTLQENNAVATVDIAQAKVTSIVALGYADHSTAGNGIDPSDRDGGISLRQVPVKGMYMPDGVASWTVQGKDTYLVMANEGDERDYDCYGDGQRVKDISVANLPAGLSADVRQDAQLGRLTVTSAAPATVAGSTRRTGLYAYGSRSVSIRKADGTLVWDSRDALERLTAAADPALFNSEELDPRTFDTRSDNKGPEPEGVAVLANRGRQYAFVGLERASGVAVYDVTTPTAPVLQQLVRTPGDVAPEGLVAIDRKDSPTGEPMLVVTNEVSGTTTLYAVDVTRG